MTQRQTEVIDNLKKEILKTRCHGVDGSCEYKEFEIEMTEHGHALVWAIVGRVNDEGTAGEFLNRYFWHVCVGPKGGCTMYNVKTKTKPQGFWNCVYTLVRY